MISQVILSLVLPVPMVALLLLSRRPAVMGKFATSRLMSVLAATATIVTLVLNAVLLVQIVQG